MNWNLFPRYCSHGSVSPELKINCRLRKADEASNRAKALSNALTKGQAASENLKPLVCYQDQGQLFSKKFFPIVMRCSEKYWVGGRAYGDLEGADVMVECSYIFKNMISTIYEQYLRCCSNAGCTQFAVGKVLLNSLFGVLFVGKVPFSPPKDIVPSDSKAGPTSWNLGIWRKVMEFHETWARPLYWRRLGCLKRQRMQCTPYFSFYFGLER